MIAITFKRTLFFLFFLLILTSVTAQLHVIFIIEKKPETHSSDAIYVAGSFNLWNPSNNTYRLNHVNSKTQNIELDLPIGNYEF